ncbi:hypothetical protein [Leptospira sp. GIMC2001]|uniref:hypothetical protein n=1 Tax=Leptospira sp. GIMC2001 TaxID=1513297 RepID=UPI00234980B8|nr:hypothetical protein [Leptospira sp. GIMC2001]WCL50298.1 hypothetical protein O4O04_05620 [Leptospira sp. GIMC2001]
MRLHDNQSIYDLATIRAFFEKDRQDIASSSSTLHISMVDLIDAWISYFWPIFIGDFISLKRFESLDRPMISFRNNLSELIDYFESLEKEQKNDNPIQAYDLFRNKLSLTRSNRIIDRNLGNKIQTVLSQIEKTILTSTVRNFKDINGRSVFQYDPKLKSIKIESASYNWLESEIDKLRKNGESNQIVITNLWLSLIQEFNTFLIKDKIS